MSVVLFIVRVLIAVLCWLLVGCGLFDVCCCLLFVVRGVCEYVWRRCYPSEQGEKTLAVLLQSMSGSPPGKT